MATIHAPELLIVMHGNATAEQVEHVVERLEEAGAQAHVSPGKQAKVIGAIGERELIAALPLEGYPGVDHVLPILKPYKLVSREISPDPTTIEVAPGDLAERGQPLRLDAEIAEGCGQCRAQPIANGGRLAGRV